MLRILLGPDQRTVREAVLGALCARAEAGESGLVLLVPEQYSHEMERRLSEAGGDAISLRAEVLSFTRLAARTFSLYGGAARKTLDKGGRLLAMSAAMEAVQPRLKLYGAGLKKPDFLARMLDVTDELKSCRVGADDLRRAADRTEGRLAVKLGELALVQESYGAVCAAVGQDPRDRLTRLRELLEENDFAGGRRFFLLGFTDFTGQELAVLEELLRGGAELCAGLVGGDARNAAFAASERTERRLTRMAGACGERAETCRAEVTGRADALAYLRDRLFRGGSEPFPGGGESLRLRRSRSVYNACLDAAGRIMASVRGGARYRDTAVCCADPEGTYPILRSIFGRFSVPAYFAGTKPMSGEPAADAVLTALDAATGGMEPEDVLGFLKSGLSPLTAEECDLLENYVLTWNIRGARWDAAWDMPPGGYGETVDDAARAALDELNGIRARGATPLLRLKAGLAAAKDTGEETLALYAFLEDIGLGRRLEELAESSAGEAGLQRAQEYAQLYERMIGALEQLYSVLGRTVRSPEDFAALFGALLTQYPVASIPAALDGVYVGAPGDVRFADVRQVVLIGADDGIFPPGQSDAGLLTELDRRELARLGVELPAGQDEQMDRQLSIIQGALSAARESLTVCACTEQPSYLFTRMAVLFPDVPVAEDPETPEILYSTADSLAMLLASRYGDALPPAPAEAEARARELLCRARYTPGALSARTVGALYGKKLCLSASRIDRYASCRCAYFLNYGLKLRPRKEASFDAPTYGTFVHAVLERTAAQARREGGFRAVTEERLLEIAGQAVEDYQDETLRRLRARSERFDYLFERNLSEVLDVVRDMGRELRRSDFEPAGFEVEFSDRGELPAVQVRGKTAEAEISGFVDRVDLWEHGGTRYVRVVDYKTGKKTFDYADVQLGVGLQMLIYLFALEENGAERFGGKLRPAGVLYFPARRSLLSAPGKLPPEAAESKREAELTRKGLLVDDETVLEAMEHGGSPVYLPYRRTAKGERVGDLADEGELRLLRRHVKRTLETMTDDICGGEVSPNPIVRGELSACAYCDYAQVCHRASGAAGERPVASMSRGEFWDALAKEAEKDG